MKTVSVVATRPACAHCGDSEPALALCATCFADLVDQDAERPRVEASLLTVAETARLLRLTPATVRGLIAERRLRAVDVAHSSSPNGRRWRVPRKAVRRFLLGVATERD